MTVGAAPGRFAGDLAYVVDAETLESQGENLLAKAAFVLVPSDLHGQGWAAGRSLASWGADIPALAELRAQGRLVRFELWTGSPHGIDGDFATEAVPLALLRKAGVHDVRTLGIVAPEPNVSGFEGLRRSGA